MNTSTTSRPAMAMLAAVIGVAVLTAFAAWSPPSIRKLLLFSVAYGLCVGAIVNRAAKDSGIRRLIAVGLTLGLTVTGLMVIAVRGHRQFEAEKTAAVKAAPDQAMARSIIEAAAVHDPQLAAQLAEEAETRELSFGDYLALRVRPLGEWSQPWPVVFWGAEVLLAAACSGFLVSRQLRSPTISTEEQT